MTEPRQVIDEIARLRKLVAAAFVGCLPQASEDFDRTRLDAQIFEEVTRIRGLMFKQIAAALRPADARPSRGRREAGRGNGARADSEGGANVEHVEDRALRVLESLQVFVLQHPVASQKMFSALVAEGRRYAATDEGARWAALLDGSTALRRARQLWESSLAGVLDDDPNAVLPSEYVEILMQGSKLTATEDLAARMADGMAGLTP